MGDRLRAANPFRYVTSQPGRLSLSPAPLKLRPWRYTNLIIIIIIITLRGTVK